MKTIKNFYWINLLGLKILYKKEPNGITLKMLYENLNF